MIPMSWGLTNLPFNHSSERFAKTKRKPTHVDPAYFPADFARRQVGPSSDPNQGLHYSEELQRLQKLMHFPEEVALQLTDTEYELFNSVPPMHFVRQVTIDLGKEGVVHHASQKKPSVQTLIQRFNEVRN